MKDFTSDTLSHDVIDGAAGYAYRLFLQAPTRWIPAALVAVVTDLQHAFQELFWVVVGLWACDLLVGLLRAFHDPGRELEWNRVFQSVIKLCVIGAGIGGVHLIEHLLVEGGIEVGEARLTTAALLVIGTAEAASVLGNMVYFWPSMGPFADRLRDMLGKKR